MTSKESAAAALASLGLTVESAFVPFSQSRNKEEERKTLNWRVTLSRNGKAFLSCDYSAGIAHCPGYAFKGRVPDNFPSLQYIAKGGGLFSNGRASRMESQGERAARYRETLAGAECESGRAMAWPPYMRDFVPIKGQEPIKPDSLDVVYSLVMDSSVLDYATFAEWAGEYGFDPDSIKGEKAYRDCLKIALQLRAAIGESGLSALSEAFQDY